MMNAYHEYKRKNADLNWCHKNFLNHRHLKSVDDVREQLKQILVKLDYQWNDQIPLQPNISAIKKCIMSGFFTQIAILQKNNVYLTSTIFHNFS